MKHQLGLTLLEVSIALSIGMAILLMATKSMEYLNRYNATHEVKSEVALLRLALEDYYFNNCHKHPFPQPTIDILKDNKYLPAQFNADNGFGSPYDVYISNTFLNYRSTTKEPPSYTIALSLHGGLSNDVYQQRLGATDTDKHVEFIKREIEIFIRKSPKYLDVAEVRRTKPPDGTEKAGKPNYTTDDYEIHKSALWKITNTERERPKSLRWTYPLPIKRQYGDRSLGRFKRFYGNLKSFDENPEGRRLRPPHEICNRLKVSESST
jgi:hypothetical protein